MDCFSCSSLNFDNLLALPIKVHSEKLLYVGLQMQNKAKKKLGDTSHYYISHFGTIASAVHFSTRSALGPLCLVLSLQKYTLQCLLMTSGFANKKHSNQKLLPRSVVDRAFATDT